MLKVIDYLRTNGLQSLIDTYHINVKKHSIYPNLIVLKYDQVESPKNVTVVDDCRGLILDTDNDFQVVSMAFRRFFNSNESHAANLDWNTATVYEKLDGSLVSLWYYAGAWQCSTSGTADASGQVGHTSQTFKDLFWKTFNDLGYKLPLNTDMVYIFELMTFDNQVLVRHAKPRLVVIGWRNRVTLEEFPVSEISDYFGYEKVKSYSLNNIKDIEASLENIVPTEMEGYVVCDANFNRIKVKSPQYVALAHLKEGMSHRRILEIIRNNENNEFISYFPEYEVQFNEMQVKYDKLHKLIDETWVIRNIDTDQKAFALSIKDLAFSSILFQLRAKKVATVKEGLQKANLDSLFGWLN